MKDAYVAIKEGVMIYTIGNNSVIIDFATEKKVILDGTFSDLFLEIDRIGRVVSKNGRYYFGAVDITLLIDTGILVFLSDCEEIDLSDPTPTNMPEKSAPYRLPDNYNLFGIDFTPIELKNLDRIIEIGFFISGDMEHEAQQINFFNMLRQSSSSGFMFYKALKEGLHNQYLDRTILTHVIMKDLGIHDARNAESVLNPQNFSVCLASNHCHTIDFIRKYQRLSPSEFINLFIFDAHLDDLKLPGEHISENLITNCNFLGYLSSLPFINKIYVFGLRGIRPFLYYDMEKIKAFTIHTINNFQEVLEQLDETCPFYISFDMDFLSPSCYSGTPAPVPGGPGFLDTLYCFDELCRERTIVGLDIVEFEIPDQVTRTTLRELYLIKDLLLSFIGSVVDHDASGAFRRVDCLKLKSAQSQWT